MKRKLLFAVNVSVILWLLSSSFANATSIAFYDQGANILSGAPDYQWWYGCAPTAAGMMMAYYDIHGYDGFAYDNLIPGGTAEFDTYPTTPDQWDFLAQSAIASQGHVNAFYRDSDGDGDPYLDSGDDLFRDPDEFDSLADFMGTSQDSTGQANGSTRFHFFTNGAKFYAQDAFNYNVWDFDGMYGMWEYFDYCGYGAGDTYNTNFYTQLTNNIPGAELLGFSFDDYKAEIDAGRVVMLHLRDHSMFGYGYGNNNEVYFHDTLNLGHHTMAWGGSYAGSLLGGVTCFTPTGGDNIIPEPGTISLLGFGLVGLLGIARSFRRRV